MYFSKLESFFLVSGSYNQVSIFNIPSTVIEGIGSLGQLLALAFLCRCFCLGSFELKRKF